MTKSPSYNHPIKPSVGGSGQFSNFVLTVVLPGRRRARAWHRAGALSWNEELLLLLPGLILQRDKLGEGTLHLLRLIFNTPSKKLSRVRSSSVTRPMSWFLVMSDYSDHQVAVRWGVVAPWQLSAVTVTTLWHILLGWAGLYVGLAGLGCNQHLQHSVSSISINFNSLHFSIGYRDGDGEGLY